MDRTRHLQLMARYNQWMNDTLYAAAATLSDAQLFADNRAFFGSLFNTLNHLVVADTIWLKRFTRHPAQWPSLAPILPLDNPQGLDQRLFHQLDELTAHRHWLDGVIIGWTVELTEADLDETLHYANTSGVHYRRDFYALATHFFNHQTHHRGQASTMLSQAGVDIGVTDLLMLIEDRPPA